MDAVNVRGLRIGDVGWAISRQAALYAQEYGWNAEFEALLCEIGRQLLSTFDPAGEAGFVAESDGAILGMAFVVRGEREGEAKLRMVYVEPAARGRGVGARLVGEAIDFAAGRGYRRMTLWTNDILHAARRIYQRAGFVLVKEEAHHSFGVDLVGQYWALELEGRR